MTEIIGENMGVVFEDLDTPYVQRYSGNIGYWPNFGVYEITDESFNKIDGISDEDWNKNYSDSWWRWAQGSNMGLPDWEFIINGQKIDAWRNKYRLQEYINEYYDLDDEEQKEYDSEIDYVDTWMGHEYKDLLEYFCEELGASTESNVCALTIDLAKYNEISLATLFRIYGGTTNGKNE